ncbi:hypothetical protein FRB99_003363 [Tulasnella sp. 403]|nr:hypothetical protein FRB99_003363 [Tulasnella sp. 403]
MSSRYAPLPTTSQQDEMNAAFDDSDDEGHDDDDHHLSGDQDRVPLLPQHHQNASSSTLVHPLADTPDSPTLDTRRPLAVTAPPPPVPGAYNFEYDYPPPPGSPPPITAYGNSNGNVPSEPVLRTFRQPNLFRRAIGALLPSHYVRDRRGGGTSNDGVFSNMTAKPTLPNSGAMVRDPATGLQYTPEEAQKDAPPSYAAAQADAVPPYWETTILAPNAPTADGELIVDQLPTGSLFSFLWNLLVSMSFQFVGFLLTYLLHTTHAAKFGSRAGLGVTLIQYGFYLRSRMDYDGTDPNMQDNYWGLLNPDDKPLVEKPPSFATPAEAADWYNSHNNTTTPTATTDPEVISQIQASASTANEWLSFFLMTVGWFVLLTALLGFWRVKRWERGVRRAAHEAANPRPPPSAEEIARDQAIVASIEQAFGLVSSRVQSGAETVRQGLGLPHNWTETPGEREAFERDRVHYEEFSRRL